MNQFLLGAAIGLLPCAALLPSQQEPRAAAEPGAPSPALAAWRSLFDGRSLKGWTTTGGRYDGAARWSVEDGALVGRVGDDQQGGLIYTDRAWHSFELTCRVKIDRPFDSGVFLRMAPEGKGAQVTLDWRPGGEIGGIYSDGWLEHRPDGAEHFRADDWNDLRIRCSGRDARIEFWLNDRKLTDHRLAATGDYAPTGLIGLQVHGELGEPAEHAARFADLWLRELPVFGYEDFDCDEQGRLTPRTRDADADAGADADADADADAGADGGWISLNDRDAWAAHGGDGSGFRFEDGTIALLAAGEASELRSTADFADFVLRLDFRIERGANSGLFLRAARDAPNPAYSGCEIQVIDDHFWEQDSGAPLAAWQRCGSLYAAVPAGHDGALYPLGCWNSYEIRYEGNTIRTELNGVELYDVDTTTVEPAQGPAFAERATSGFIGLQRHAPARASGQDCYARYRNIWIKRL